MFDMIDFEIIQQYLRIDFDRTLKEVFIHQTNYAKRIFKKFGTLKYKFVCTLISKRLILVNNAKASLCNTILFYQLIGKFMFLTII